MRACSLLLSCLPLLIALGGCGPNSSGPGGAASGGSDPAGGSSGSSASSGSGGSAGSADPCAGKACGDPCDACGPDADCDVQACDASGACVFKDKLVCGLCPATAPDDGAPCPKVNLVCELEDGPVLVCRARLTCTMNGWLTTAPGCSSEVTPDPKCPATAPMGACDTMTEPGLCELGDTLCGCSDCLGGPCGGAAMWVCSQKPAAPCPATAPKLGTPCDADMLHCDYGACPLGGTPGGRICSEGLWTEQITACPE